MPPGNPRGRLHKFSDSHGAARGETATMSFDMLYFVKGFGSEVCRPAVRATHNGDVFDSQQAGAFTVASGQMPNLGSAATAVLTAEYHFFLVTS